MANFVALAAARGSVLRAAGWDVERDGLFGAPPVTVLAGAEAHVTVRSALQYLGLGHGRVTVVEADSEGRIVPAAFARTIAAVAGPTIVVLQAGQVNTGAFDLFAELIPLARAKGAWVHVDGAFGLFARAEPGLRPLTDGMEGADSWSTDGHKWLQIPFDSGFVFVRDAEAHHRAMIISESYLPAAGADDRDPGNTVPELSRRARGFAVWAMLQHLGRSGVAALVREHCRLARHFAARLAAEPGIAVINDVVLNQVLVRFGADEPDERGDALTRETIAAIQVDGTAFAGGGSWRGRWVMRLSVISWATTEADIDRSAGAMIAAWRKVRDH
jgi:glutamate/tyrosine decarboxylase-like PLP-dependent enzyme